MAKYPFRSEMTTIISNVNSSLTVHHEDVVTPEGCLNILSQSSFIPWDNPDNILSQHVEKTVDTVVGVICLPILFLISAPTNILNMLVFWKQGLKERINLCLFYLSLVDLIHMLNAFFCNVDRLLLPFSEGSEFGPVFRFIIDNKLTGLRSISWLSGFVSMLIACERCFCVVSPLRSKTVLSTKTTGLILGISSVFCMAGSAVMGMRWALACVFDPVTNTTSTVMYASQFYFDNKVIHDIMSLYIATIQPFVILTIIMVTTAVTSVKLTKMVAWRKQTSSCTMSWREVALTRMLIAASVLYIICSIPTTVLGASVMFVPDMNLDGRYYNLVNFFISLYELASYFNASFNFFIYCVLGSKYRETLKSLLNCMKFTFVSS